MAQMSTFAETIMRDKYAHETDIGRETWEEIAYRVTKHVYRAVGVTMSHSLARSTCLAIRERRFMPAGRYLYAAGRPYHQTQNCLALRAEDSREGWADLLRNVSMALMTGAGVGVEYSQVRPSGKSIRRTGGSSTGPLALAQMINEVSRGIIQGGNRRGALWAGINWRHADCGRFVVAKDWSAEVRASKDSDWSSPAPLDGTNVSVGLDDEFFTAYHDENHPLHAHAYSTYWQVVEHMCRTGEPGFTVNVGSHNGELRNACTEFISADDSDICNLGSVHLGQCRTVDDFRQAIRLAVPFLLAGSVYSDVPYSGVDRVRTRNRKIGLGLLGVHEWLLQRGKQYGPDDELGEWLDVYVEETELAAARYAKEWDLRQPLSTRAIAPNGTIGIVAETTGGIEPVFCVAYKRRYFKHDTWYYQYVVDSVARRLIESGVKPEEIEDAYTLAGDVERRIQFQSWIQQWVDMGISSTINLPAWGSEHNNERTTQEFGRVLMGYLPSLRGITCYPDGSRGGQPLVPVHYATAMRHVGRELVEETRNVCELTGGSCGD